MYTVFLVHVTVNQVYNDREGYPPDYLLFDGPRISEYQIGYAPEVNEVGVKPHLREWRIKHVEHIQQSTDA